MTREELAILLDGEAHLTAADRVRGGADPRSVLAELRPFIPRFNDRTSREAVAVFQDICAGRESVVDGRFPKTDMPSKAELERLFDAAVQRRLSTDRAYRHAENAEEQKLREEQIENEELDRIRGRYGPSGASLYGGECGEGFIGNPDLYEED